MLLDVPSSYRDPSGKWVHHFRQSDVKRWRMCPEQHRLTLLRSIPDRDQDSAAIGIAVHAGIQLALEALRDGFSPSFSESNSVAQAEWLRLWHGDNFARTEVATIEEGCALVYDCIERFWNLALEPIQSEPVLRVEHQFNHEVHSDDDRTIKICGQRDTDSESQTIDFKTSNRSYSKEGWKYNRYDVQPTFYSWARAIDEQTEELKPFTFIVIPREGKPQIDWLTVERTWSDIDFLLEELLSMATLIEAELPRWPLGPTDWWCSNKWCTAWMQCRGKHIGEDPWGLAERMNVNLTKKEAKQNGK